MNFKREYKWIVPVTIIVSVLCIWLGGMWVDALSPQNQGETETLESQSLKGIVTEIIGVYDAENEYSNTPYQEIAFRVNVTGAPLEGTEVVAIQTLDVQNFGEVKKVEVGDRITLVNFHNSDFNTDWVFEEYVRTNQLILLGGMFAVLLIVFGRLKGVKTLVTLVLTVLAIFNVYIPGILAGVNIYGLTFLLMIYMTLMTLVVVSGANIKTTSAIIGCMGGISVAAILVLIMGNTLHLTGLIDDESMYLMLMNPENPINLKGIIFGGILIGAMGAVMDVAMSISASLYELQDQVHDVTPSSLFKSGMTIGRDIMGTMSNTLILAYIGSSLSIILILTVYSPSLEALVNREFVVVEILQALAGSFGILFTIPLTALASSILYKIHKREVIQK
jgi:uncharacterized membrane protein